MENIKIPLIWLYMYIYSSYYWPSKMIIPVVNQSNRDSLQIIFKTKLPFSYRKSWLITHCKTLNVPNFSLTHKTGIYIFPDMIQNSLTFPWLCKTKIFSQPKQPCHFISKHVTQSVLSMPGYGPLSAVCELNHTES